MVLAMGGGAPEGVGESAMGPIRGETAGRKDVVCGLNGQ